MLNVFTSHNQLPGCRNGEYNLIYIGLVFTQEGMIERERGQGIDGLCKEVR